MTCAEVNDRIVDRLYDELGAVERAAFDAHVDTCPACAAEVASLRRTLGVAREAVRGPLAQDLPAGLGERLRAAAAAAQRPASVLQGASAPAAVRGRASAPDPEETPSFWRWLRRPWVVPSFVAAGAMLVLVVARGVVLDDSALERAAAPAASPPPRELALEDRAAAAEEAAGAPPADEPGAPERPRGAGPRRSESKKESGPKSKRALDDDPLKGLGELGGARKGAAGGRPAAGVEARRSTASDGYAARPAPAPAEAAAAARDESAPAAAAPTRARIAAPARRQAEAETDLATDDEAPRGAGRAGAAVGAPPAAAPAAAPPAAPAAAPKADEKVARPLEEVMERASRAFAGRQFAEAARLYGELLRRAPAHPAASDWRRRLQASQDALAP
jgi:hypothetical protein